MPVLSALAVTRHGFAILLLTAAATLCAQAGSHTEKFQVAFQKGSATLPPSGPFVDINAEAIKLIASAIRRAAVYDGGRLVFIAKRPACDLSGECQGEVLTVTRVQQLKMAILASVVKGGGTLSYRRIEYVFAEDGGIDDSLLGSSTDVERIMLAFIPTAAISPGLCAGRISVDDPSLPPVLPAGRLTLPASAEVMTGPETSLSLAAGSPDIPMVWEDDAGRFRIARSKENSLGRLPAHVAGLHIIFGSESDANAKRFLSLLNYGAFTAAERPLFLPSSRTASSETRAVGNDIGPLDPTSVRPAKQKNAAVSPASPFKAAALEVCTYKFAANAAF